GLGALSRSHCGGVGGPDPGQDGPAAAGRSGRGASRLEPARGSQAERGPGHPSGDDGADRDRVAIPQASGPEEARMKPLRPMLATAAAPFDSEAFLFEVKWDGVRALAARAAGPWRLWGRTGADYPGRYPELAVLSRLPTGTVVDGELVVLQGGRADFPALLRRHQRPHVHPLGASVFQQRLPVTYVLFDLLFERGRSLLQTALVQRRARLQEVLFARGEPVLAYSAGGVGRGDHRLVLA